MIILAVRCIISLTIEPRLWVRGSIDFIEYNHAEACVYEDPVRKRGEGQPTLELEAIMVMYRVAHSGHDNERLWSHKQTWPDCAAASQNRSFAVNGWNRLIKYSRRQTRYLYSVRS